jgi:hypothetical protein
LRSEQDASYIALDQAFDERTIASTSQIDMPNSTWAAFLIALNLALAVIVVSWLHNPPSDHIPQVLDCSAAHGKQSSSCLQQSSGLWETMTRPLSAVAVSGFILLIFSSWFVYRLILRLTRQQSSERQALDIERTLSPEHAIEEAIREHTRHHERLSAATETAVQSGQMAVRTAVLINGGAAISVLAFIGGLVAQRKASIPDVTAVATSLMWFAAGTALGVASLGSSYLVQYCVRWSIELQHRSWTPPYIRPSRSGQAWFLTANLLRVVAILAAIISLLLFIIGMWRVHDAITQLKLN